MKVDNEGYVTLELHEYKDIKQQLKELKNEIEKLKETEKMAQQCWIDHLACQHDIHMRDSE